MVDTLKSHRPMSCHCEEQLRKAWGAFKFAKRVLLFRAVIPTCLAWRLRALPVPDVRRTFDSPERHGLASMTHW